VNKKRFYTEDGKRIDLDMQIKAGREGKIFRLNDRQLVAKIYDDEGHEPPTWREEKLRWLKEIGNKNVVKGACFPKQLLFNSDKSTRRCVGFIMRYQRGDTMGATVFNASVVTKYMRWTRRDLVILAQHLLRRFITLHNIGIYMADLNPNNIIVTNYDEVHFIDVDSYQVNNRFPCPVYHPDFVSPRVAKLQAEQKGDLFITNEDECYAISVMLFAIFLVGSSPYNSRSGSIEQNRREHNFRFPLGYEDDNEMPAGPFPRIWYNLPYNMRKAFYDIFHDGIFHSLEDWMKILEEYLEGLKMGVYSNIIFPDIAQRKTFFLGGQQLYINLEKDEHLRLFDNCKKDDDINERNTCFLEFGTNIFKGYDVIGRGRTKLYPIQTNHFDLIDCNGRIDAKKLTTILKENEQFKFWTKLWNGRTPPITHILGFGGTILRSLINRDEIIKELKKAIGLSFGILTPQEEASMLIEECETRKNSLVSQSLVIVDVNGINTQIILREKGKQPVITTFNKLGTRVLRNWLLHTVHPETTLAAILDSHDYCVDNELEGLIAPIKRNNFQLIGMGVMRAIPQIFQIHKVKEKKVSSYQKTDILKLREDLNNDLTLNRTYAHELMDDINMASNDTLSRKVDLRLGLSVYIKIMRQLEQQDIVSMPFGVGDAFVRHTLNNKYS